MLTCCKCLKNFICWSITQKMQLNVSALVRRVCMWMCVRRRKHNFTSHPSLEQQQGWKEIFFPTLTRDFNYCQLSLLLTRQEATTLFPGFKQQEERGKGKLGLENSLFRVYKLLTKRSHILLSPPLRKEAFPLFAVGNTDPPRTPLGRSARSPVRPLVVDLCSDCQTTPKG